jgi:rhodanese-related sulfurtransferase
MGANALQPRQLVSMLVLIAALALSALSSPRHSTAPQFNVKEVTALEAKALLEAGAIVIDVRDRAASADMHLPGALLIPLEVLDANLGKIEAAKTSDVIVYCGDGSTRGPEAAAMLNKAGFTQVVNLKSGMQGWRAAGLPTFAS